MIDTQLSKNRLHMDSFFIRLSAAMSVGALLLGASGTASFGQPAPSFLATCGELRAAIERLAPEEAGLVTIEVVGRLAAVRDDGALVYLSMCAPPDPRVVCVTYETNGRKVGDEVILSGGYIPRGSDFIQLDPCLHHLPE